MLSTVLSNDFLIFTLIVLLSYSIQALSGFGSTVISVTLGLHFYTLDFLLPVLIPLDLVVNGYLTIRYRSTISRSILVNQILPFMGIGLIIGILIFQFSKADVLKTACGIFVFLIAIQGLFYHVYRKISKISSARFSMFTLFAGIFHGMFASGGPLIVYAMSGIELSKATFRSTLSTIWATMSCIMIVSFIVSGRMNITTLFYISVLFPIILLGILIGEKLHAETNEYYFGITTYLLLIGAGLALII